MPELNADEADKVMADVLGKGSEVKAVTQAEAATRLEASIFDDESLIFGELPGRKVWNFSPEINNVTFYCRTLAPQVLAGLNRRAEELERKRAQAIGLATEEEPADADTLLRQIVALTEEGIGLSLQGWESPNWPKGKKVPVTPENIARMAKPIKMHLFDIIRSASAQGQEASEVFPSSSAQD